MKKIKVLPVIGLLFLVLALILITYFLNFSKPESRTVGTHASSFSPPDGQGMYESCPPKWGQKCLDNLALLAHSGFKLVVNYDLLVGNQSYFAAYLSKAQALHMRVILPLNNTHWWDNTGSPLTDYPDLVKSCNQSSFAPCSTNSEFLKYIVNLVHTNPSLWGYYVGDEVHVNNFSQLKIFTDQIKVLDVTHPRLFVDYTPSGSGTLNPDLITLTSSPNYPSADIATLVGQDFYPIGSYPPFSDDSTKVIGPALNTLRNNNQQGKGVVKDYAMVLQAHSFLPYQNQGYGCKYSLQLCPYPSVLQMSTMYNNLVQNAQPRMVLWYSLFDLLNSSTFPYYHLSNTLTAAGLNAIKTPSFEPWYGTWSFRGSDGGGNVSGLAKQECITTSTPFIDSSCYAHVTVTKANPTYDYDINFTHQAIPLTANRPTYISFDAKNANNGTMYFVLSNSSTYKTYYVQTVKLTANWKHYTYVINNKSVTDQSAQFSMNFADSTGDVWVSSVSVVTP